MDQLLAKAAEGSCVLLICPPSRVPLYTRHGFKPAPSAIIPASLAVERAIGAPIAKLAIGEGLEVLYWQSTA